MTGTTTGEQLREYEKHSNMSARTRNDENVAEVCTIMTSDRSMAIEQLAYKIVISCG
jgi:hypothetical protein